MGLGLQESWQWDHFTNAELEDVFLESSVWGEMADPDEDGRTNLLEYAQGTDPRSSANRSRSLTIGANDHSQVVLRMRIDDPALTYTLEAIEDLSSASWISGLFAEVGGRVPDLEDAAYEFVTMEAEKVEKLVPKVFGDEFDLAGFVVFPAFGSGDDGEETPVSVVDGVLEIAFEIFVSFVGVSGFDEVVDEAEEEGAEVFSFHDGREGSIRRSAFCFCMGREIPRAWWGCVLLGGSRLEFWRMFCGKRCFMKLV